MPKFKAILLDLDNTLYSYSKAHEPALSVSLEWLGPRTGCCTDKLFDCYANARAQLHVELGGVAASHHRLLYFQRMLEIIGDGQWALTPEVHQVYWKTYLEHMQPVEGMRQFLDSAKEVPICLVTDFVADLQYRKMDRLGISADISYLVTSEESGVDKPHPYIFHLALRKLNATPDQVCMVGDSYEKDIIGATRLGIESFWVSDSERDVRNSKNITKVASLRQLLEVWSCQPVNR